MADYTWPTGLSPATFEIGLRANVQIASSAFNGAVQTSEVPGDRWVATLSLAPSPPDTDAQPDIEAFFAKLRAQANRIVMGHLGKSSRGTLSGTITTGSAVLGATSITISGTGAPAAADMVVLTTAAGSQFVMVTAFSGGTMTFSPPLRAAVSNGSTLNYATPTTKWIVMSPEVMIGYGAHSNPSVSVDLMEVWD